MELKENAVQCYLTTDLTYEAVARKFEITNFTLLASWVNHFKIYGEVPNLENLDDKTSLDAVVKMIGELPRPIIAPFLGQSFRFIPQRSVMDNVLMQNVVDVKEGPIPSKRPIY